MYLRRIGARHVLCQTLAEYFIFGVSGYSMLCITCNRNRPFSGSNFSLDSLGPTQP